MMQNNEDNQAVIELFRNIEQVEALEKKHSAIQSIAYQYKYKKEELFDDFALVLIQSTFDQKLWECLKVFSLISIIREKFNIYTDLSIDAYLMRIYNKVKEEKQNTDDIDDEVSSFLVAIEQFRHRLMFLSLILNGDNRHIVMDVDDHHVDFDFVFKAKEKHGRIFGHLFGEWENKTEKFGNISSIENDVKNISKMDLEAFMGLR